MTDQFLGLSARADIHPDMLHFKRQASPGDWIKSEPIKGYGIEMLRLVGIAASGPGILLVLWALFGGN